MIKKYKLAKANYLNINASIKIFRVIVVPLPAYLVIWHFL